MPFTQIIVPTNSTDQTMRRSYPDDMIAPGTLYLYDTAHDTMPAIASDLTGPKVVPASGSALTNVAARALLQFPGGAITDGGPGVLAYSSAFTTSGAITSSTLGRIERSGCGGVHVVCAQQGPDGSGLSGNTYAAFKIGSSLMASIAANFSDQYYFSAWRYVTRDVPSSSTGGHIWSGIGNGPQSSGQLAYAIKQAASTDVNGDVPTVATGMRILGGPSARIDQPSPYIGVSFAAIAGGLTLNGATSFPVPTGPADNGGRSPFQWGTPSPFSASLPNDAPSYVAWRCFGENITKSGRSAAQLLQMDLARFAAATAPGGRFYGDSVPTNPTSIP